VAPTEARLSLKDGEDGLRPHGEETPARVRKGSVARVAFPDLRKLFRLIALHTDHA